MILSKFCSCGKIVSGVNEIQLDYNYKTHLKSKEHKRQFKLKKEQKFSDEGK